MLFMHFNAVGMGRFSFSSLVSPASELILSIIGLGVHIGMLFNKKIIVLSGPTFFNELKKRSGISGIEEKKNRK